MVASDRHAFHNANVEDLDAQPAVADEQLRQPQVVSDPAPEESNVVEYPDGAPPQVIREMKEPDDTMPFHPKRSGKWWCQAFYQVSTQFRWIEVSTSGAISTSNT